MIEAYARALATHAESATPERDSAWEVAASCTPRDWEVAGAEVEEGGGGLDPPPLVPGANF